MNRPYLVRCRWLAVPVLLVILLVSGCGSDDPTTPAPPPVPKVSVSLACNSGLIDLKVRNSGAAMAEPSPFIVAFTDGHSDTLLLSVAAGDSMTCRLSNIHGGVTVSNEEWNLVANTDDCLAAYFESLAAPIDLGSYIPSPLTTIDLVVCTYTISLRNFHYTPVTFQLIRTADGLTLRYVYSNITADISGPAPGWWCADITGNLAISSIVAETKINIGAGDDPPITLGETKTTIDGLQVNINGAFGTVVSWIVGWFGDDFANMLTNAIGSEINGHIGADLESLVIVRSSCEE